MKINVLDVKENPNGSADLLISYDKELKLIVLKYYKRKRLTKKLMERFVIEGLTNYIKSQEKCE